MIGTLNNITLRECSHLSEAEILLRGIPQDNTAGHVDFILDKINKGEARALDIKKFGVKVGFCIVEKCGSDFWVLAMKGTKFFNVKETVLPHLETLAREVGCSTVRFKTVRAGLIELGLESGFAISSVEMFKTL